jgi:hypothetical protein
MLADLLADSADLIESFLDSLRSGDFAGNPDGKENRAEVAVAHARDVDAAVGVADAQVELVVEQALRGVVVRVDDDRRKVKFLGTLGNAVASYHRGHE